MPISPEMNCLKSIRSCLSCTPKDMSRNHRDAWVFGIVFGWGSALEEVAEMHEWDAETVDKLKHLRIRYKSLDKYESSQLTTEGDNHAR